MKQAKWMWNAGDFERYHGMLLHNKRTKYGLFCAPMWRIDVPSPNITVYKTATLTVPETLTVYSNTDDVIVIANNRRNPPGMPITLQPGHHSVRISAYKQGGFPAIYCEGNSFASDETWNTSIYGEEDAPVGTNEMYTDRRDDPGVFKFSYQRVLPVASQKTEDGTLYDFGRELFGKVILQNVDPVFADVKLILGESREEALDPKHAIVQVQAQVRDGSFVSEAVALRYILVPNFGDYELSLDYEYLPIPDKASFHCNDALINKVWEVAAYTLHLNAREAFFDGIKRDRWVWSGDAYQSYFVNYYLMGDRDIVRRTQRILRGAEPMTTHINTISDYTFYWIISMWEYYYHTGDLPFIKEMYGSMLSVMKFVRERLDADGLYQKLKGDWVFIDWYEYFDKDAGPLSAEHMLLCHAYQCMANCAGLLDDTKRETEYAGLAAEVKRKINDRFWDEEKGAFVDSDITGNRNVTRHANIFALLFDLTTQERKQSIVVNVIKNTDIPPITTPYFEFFELDAMCRIGEFSYMTDMLHNYWGGMLDMGATTFWEEYFPQKSYLENLALDNQDIRTEPYNKSLCHAWGASPIYLLGKYALGVRPTSPAYATYEVCPKLMCFREFEGEVPTPHGIVSVKLRKDAVSVLSEVDGGVLVIGSKTYPILKNEPLTVCL